jgi:hypothetical protein
MLGPDPDFLFGTHDFTWQLGRASNPCTSLEGAVAVPGVLPALARLQRLPRPALRIALESFLIAGPK